MAEKAELEEIKRLLSNKPQEETKEARIIYDGKQYSVRIPADFANAMNIDPKTDGFKFTLTVSVYEEGKEPVLTGVLVHGKEETAN